MRYVDVFVKRKIKQFCPKVKHIVQNEKEGGNIGQNMNAYKKLQKLCGKNNLGKGILCMVKKAKIGMELFKFKNEF